MIANSIQLHQVARQTLVYGGGILLTKAVAFVMLPLYTNYLTPTDYGVLALIQMTLDVSSIFAGASMVGGVFRFFSKARTPAEQHLVLSTALLILSASYALIGLATFASASRLSDLLFGDQERAEALIQIASGNLVCEGALLLPLAYLRIQERSVLFVLVQVAKLMLQLTLNIFFLILFQMGVRGVLLGSLVTNAVFAVLLVPYLLREVPLRFSGQAARDLLRYGVPFIGTHVATFVLAFGDRYFLQRSAGSAVVGLYTLSYQFGFLLATLVYTPFAMVWEPARFEVAKQPNKDEAYASCFIYLNVALMTLATLIALFVGDFLRVMANPAFQGAAAIVPLILAAYVLQTWANFLSIGMLVRERTEFVTLANWGAALLVLILYWLWIPPLLGLGAALATLVAFAARSAIVYVASQRLWPVRYRWRQVLRLTGVSSLTVSVGILAPHETVVASVAIRMTLFALYLAALWYLPILSESERSALRRLVRALPIAVWSRIGAGGKLETPWP